MKKSLDHIEEHPLKNFYKSLDGILNNLIWLKMSLHIAGVLD